MDLVLILARNLFSSLATAVFLVDAEGTLVYYNESAEAILGRTFEDTGEMKRDEWVPTWTPEDLEGNPLALEELPLYIAQELRKPAYRPMRIKGLDGENKEIEVTAFPLFATAEEFVGAVAIFWMAHEGGLPR